jgi:hypothetical protein
LLGRVATSPADACIAVLRNSTHSLVAYACAAETANGANGYQKPAPKLMVCNRGEIARRVIRTANHHGLETIAIYTEVSCCWYGFSAAAAAATCVVLNAWLWDTPSVSFAAAHTV